MPASVHVKSVDAAHLICLCAAIAPDNPQSFPDAAGGSPCCQPALLHGLPESYDRHPAETGAGRSVARAAEAMVWRCHRPAVPVEGRPASCRPMGGLLRAEP